MTLKNSYDVIVSGNALSGLLAAALLRVRGADVLLLPGKERQLPEAKGFELDSFMLPPGGIPKSPAVTEVLASLGVDLGDRGLFRPVAPLFQVVFDRHRLDIRGRRDLLAEALSMEFSDDIEAVLDALPGREALRERISELLRSGKDLHSPRVLKKLSLQTGRSSVGESGTSGLSQPLRRFFSLSMNFSLPIRPLPFDPLFFPFPFDTATAYSPKGGMTAFRRLVMERLEAMGVTVLPDHRAEGLTVRKRRITAVETGDRKRSIRTGAFIFADLPASLVPLLPAGLMTRSFRKRLELHIPWGRWRSLFVGVAGEKIPVAMGETVLTEGKGGVPLMIRMIPDSGERFAGGAVRLLKVSTPVSYGTGAGDDSGSGAAENDLGKFDSSHIDKLRELVPFLGEAFEILCLDDGEPSSPDDYIFHLPPDMPPRPGTISPITPYRNTFLAGREPLAVLGVEGDFILAGMLTGHTEETLSA